MAFPKLNTPASIFYTFACVLEFASVLLIIALIFVKIVTIIIFLPSIIFSPSIIFILITFVFCPGVLAALVGIDIAPLHLSVVTPNPSVVRHSLNSNFPPEAAEMIFNTVDFRITDYGWITYRDVDGNALYGPNRRVIKVLGWYRPKPAFPDYYGRETISYIQPYSYNRWSENFWSELSS